MGLPARHQFRLYARYWRTAPLVVGGDDPSLVAQFVRKPLTAGGPAMASGRQMADAFGQAPSRGTVLSSAGRFASCPYSLLVL